MTGTILWAYRSNASHRGFTLLEITLAVSLTFMVAVSASGLSVLAGRLYKIIRTQQQALGYAKQATETINRAIHTASTPVIVSPAPTGNRVTFKRSDSAITQAFELKSVDKDMNTPWDNELIYDPDTSVNGDEILVARWLVPIDAAGAFTNPGGDTPLLVRMRCGDPVDSKNKYLFTSGPGMQGIEINLAVSPRNTPD